MDYPSEHLLNSIEEIAAIKNSLSLGDRSLTSAKGLYVHRKGLPSGEVEYAAGGRFSTKIAFVKELGGGRNIKKYQPGDWEFRVEETLELCRTLKRATEDLKNWPPEKTKIYESGEIIDTDLVEKVSEVNIEHYEENHRQWRLRGLPRWLELRDKFLSELKEEWPIEYAELQLSQKSEKGITDLIREHITKAYVTGYMYGRGWISPEEMTQANLYLGDVVAEKVRRGFKGAKSRGIAFADVLAHIAVLGTVSGSVPEGEKGEKEEKPEAGGKSGIDSASGNHNQESK
jgi:hypothetical protein